MTLLHDVKLSGLDCVLPVVHANHKLLLARRGFGVRKGELGLGLCDVVPDATVLVLIAELHQVLRCHP